MSALAFARPRAQTAVARRHVILIGAPGSGKGTQGALIAKTLQVPVFSTGDALRQEIRAGSELGRVAAPLLRSGALVPDDLVNSIVAERLSYSDCTNGAVLDGYPRSLPQALFLASLLEERGEAAPCIVHLDVRPYALMQRLSGRRQCPACKTIYARGAVAGELCPRDRVPLELRPDDQPHVVRRRLEVFRNTFGPLLEFYETGDYHRIDGEAPPDAIAAQIRAIF